MTSVVGGVSGYGSGLLLPPVLIPIVGARAVVPMMSVAALLINVGRVTAYRATFDRRKAMLVIAFALPTCLLAAYGYTRLSGPHIAVLIGCVLILAVPLRYWMRSRKGTLTTPWLAASASGFGLVMGASSGTGVIDLAILLAAGLQGSAVIATDAGISLALNSARVVLFQGTGTLSPSTWILAILIGAVSVPGAFLAKVITDRLPLRIHTYLLDAIVVAGGIVLIAQGLG